MTPSRAFRSLPGRSLPHLVAVWKIATLFVTVLTLTLAFSTRPAHADDYADVTQLQHQGKSNEALAKADLYIAGKPRDPQMRFLRGVILNEQGKQADATAAFTALTQDFPELPEPYNNLAALYASQSKFDQARAALETAIKLNPFYATAHENLGDIYVQLAGQSYGRALQLEPGIATIPRKLALVRQLFASPVSPAPSAVPVPARKPSSSP